MGTTAGKIAAKIASQLKPNVFGLMHQGAAQAIVRDSRLDADRVRKLTAKGHDPCHAIYTSAQNFASVVGEQLSGLTETRPFVKIVGDAEDEYQPSGPPISPLSTSYFTMWALFDVLFGSSHETIGTCILRIAQVVQIPPALRDAIGHMQRSSMGVYVHCGTEGRFVRLRALDSEEPQRCLVTSGYVGRPGELWYVRVLPPVGAQFDYHIVFNSPYILVGITERMFADYLARAILRLNSQKLPVDMDASAYIMKHGPSPNHWNEYIFCAYKGYQHDAIFLTGIPDIKASLPHGKSMRTKV